MTSLITHKDNITNYLKNTKLSTLIPPLNELNVNVSCFYLGTNYLVVEVPPKCKLKKNLKIKVIKTVEPIKQISHIYYYCIIHMHMIF